MFINWITIQIIHIKEKYQIYGSIINHNFVIFAS